ncbi:MAG TPA: A/G-specific adenine glycosylase, partial [Candidatus Polarisedimenticolia bacterium]|nr:A/G-specific adenine glycosylase [Candidatus Polarisedimenticolia bacterium]
MPTRAAQPEQLARRLLAWYSRSARDLPWRRRRDPYRVWVSEVMLQQTTVQTAAPYFRRFVRRFPTLRSLAAAPEADLLALWSGLGYYHRARNMLKAARLMVERHRGRVPASLPELR